ncbi:MAG TPA: hypothetical protein VE978_01545 [Chitinophagales bacterium]|nr:hypothetical protein [Chitinophagales bacterium]
MKTIMLLFVLLSSNQQCNQSGQLKLLKATSQSWSGGAAATRGVYYNIYLGMALNADYIFDSLWVDGKRLPIGIKPAKATDTLTLLANDRMGVRMPGTDIDPSKSVEANSPVATDAEGVLGYFYKGNRKYLAIPTFQKLKPLAYP